MPTKVGIHAFAGSFKGVDGPPARTRTVQATVLIGQTLRRLD
jgi:hypothetical protein